jgi:hypothetical protein
MEAHLAEPADTAAQGSGVFPTYGSLTRYGALVQ